MPFAPQERFETARFLVIDGDRAGAALLCRGLGASAAAGEIVTARTGRQAAETLRVQRFDVVLMDLSSLFDLAAHPQEGVAKLVKLAEGALTIALSDGASVSAAVEVMRAGAHDCVARPIDADALAHRIAELARRHGKARMLGLTMPQATNDSADLRPSHRLPPALPVILPMWQQEQRIIEDAIASFSGNIALAAAALQLSPSTIYRKRQAWAEMEDKRGAA